MNNYEKLIKYTNGVSQWTQTEVLGFAKTRKTPQELNAFVSEVYIKMWAVDHVNHGDPIVRQNILHEMIKTYQERESGIEYRAKCA